jgi:DNA end-binding protein Ku
LVLLANGYMEFHLGSYMAARSIWKGAISFGLVNIPIQVFSAEQKEEYSSFSQLCQKGHKIKYKKWCPVEEREVPRSEIKKGYEITSIIM